MRSAGLDSLGSGGAARSPRRRGAARSRHVCAALRCAALQERGRRARGGGGARERAFQRTPRMDGPRALQIRGPTLPREAGAPGAGAAITRRSALTR
eukprot:scaffold6036_cov371-Prasinococcus_capsulatus_cf.AAC.1